MATLLSKNFSLEELCASSTARTYAIDNRAGLVESRNLQLLCENVLQPLRDHVAKAIKIGSGFRCKKLNQLVGGAATSQHMTGEAADICLPLLPNGKQDLETGKQWFEFIRKNLKFDQLIWEHNKKGSYWIHVSYSRTRCRKMVINDLLKK